MASIETGGGSSAASGASGASAGVVVGAVPGGAVGSGVPRATRNPAKPSATARVAAPAQRGAGSGRRLLGLPGRGHPPGGLEPEAGVGLAGPGPVGLPGVVEGAGGRRPLVLQLGQRRREVRAVPVAPVGVLGEGLHDQLLEARAHDQGGPDRPHRSRALLEVLHEDRDHRVRVVAEWRAAGEHLVHHDAQRVDVAPGVDRLPLALLGGHVLRRAHQAPGHGELLLPEPKVLATPKSRTTTQSFRPSRSGSTMMLSGLRSRWTIPCGGPRPGPRPPAS